MSDIMDEFEFKPLTEGLGFQKKNTEQVKVQFSAPVNVLTPLPVAEPATKSEMDAAIAHLEKGGTFGRSRIPDLKPTSSAATSQGTSLSTPLPRGADKISDSHLQLKRTNPAGNTHNTPTTSVDEILKTLQDRKMPQLSTPAARQRIDATPEPVKYTKTTWDFAAFMLDVMLVVASNLMCLIILMFTTHVDLFSNLFNPDSSGMIYKSLAALVLGTTWIYLVVNRIFIGCTPGEWVFDQRIGFPKDTGSAMYSLKIVLRTTLTVFTGLILFPLASTFLNEDILGTWMDLPLLKKA